MKAHIVCRSLAALLLASLVATSAPSHGFDARSIAIVVNADDAGSVALGDYYRRARSIPAERVYSVNLGARDRVEPAIFMRAWHQLYTQLPDAVQALALAWTRPWRVHCMSVTSAFAFGYDRRHCAAGCKSTAGNPLYATPGMAPWRDWRIRPAMLLASSSPEQARRLVDRGVAADATHPQGTAYLVSTTDRARNVRARGYADLARVFERRFNVVVHEGNELRGRDDVMFYFTGRAKVGGIDDNRYLPGAVADHLTSYGGRLDGTSQMSILRWLEAGATASFGAVVEPCSYRQKFPNPAVMMRYYLAGDSVLSAYWKSVRWPGQGLFVGEPLARPFARAARSR